MLTPTLFNNEPKRMSEYNYFRKETFSMDELKSISARKKENEEFNKYLKNIPDLETTIRVKV